MSAASRLHSIGPGESRPQQALYFLPLPQGHGLFLEGFTLVPSPAPAAHPVELEALSANDPSRTRRLQGAASRIAFETGGLVGERRISALGEAWNRRANRRLRGSDCACLLYTSDA